MSAKAPGRSHREGITIIELFRMFPDDAAAEKWFEAQRWPDGRRFCPECGSLNYAHVKNSKPMPYRCRDCRSHFSVRKGTVMQGSPLGLQLWVIAIYMMTTGIKGTSSMKLHRELGITQKTAWYLMQRIREGFLEGVDKPMPGPVEVDETYIGGKRKNMSNAKRRMLKNTGRGPVGKVAVVGAKDRATKRVAAQVVDSTDGATLQGFVAHNAGSEAMVYTDDASAYKGIPNRHETVKHTVKEFVRGQAHTNGIESFWALFKRGYVGTFHQMSKKHLHRYVREFAGRHNIRDLDTLEQMAYLSRGMVGKRLRYEELIS